MIPAVRSSSRRIFGAAALSVAVLAFLFPCAGLGGQAKSDLEVVQVRLDPVRQGKNIVRVSVRNLSPRSQSFVIGIQANSPDYGRGAGWGTQFPDTVGPGETKDMRFAYRIMGPVTDKTRLALSFYNPSPPGDPDPRSYFLRRVYVGPELGPAKPPGGATLAAPADKAAAAVSAVRSFLSALKAGNFRVAWEAVTADFRAVYFSRTEADLAKTVASDEAAMSPYLWPADELVGFEPGPAAAADDGRVRLGGAAGRRLVVYLAFEGGRWKIDEIGGFTPRVVLWANWEERLLPTLKTKRTEHFDIFYKAGSTAEREIGRIAAERERGCRDIAGFLDLHPESRIRLVFFEDGRTKFWETGHRGAGWAYDRTIVEVFNETERLDPFHEVCHILTDGLGAPPALFNEGLAVAMSEQLGSPALKSLGGGTLSVDQRVRELKSRNAWVPLDRLIQFTEIGSDESQPEIAYAEAGSFVKYLIEEFGREKFLAAYRSLKSSDDPAVREKNIKLFVDIYGGSIAGHEAAWIKKISSAALATQSQTPSPAAKSAAVIEVEKLAGRLDRFIDPYVRAHDFSGIVLIAQGTKVLARKAYGLADLSAKIPVKPEMVFRIASLSKTFTAAAIEMLIEQGRIHLEDRLIAFVPGFPNGDRITIRDLLLHRSGVGVLDDPALVTTCHSSGDLVAALNGVKPLFEPGTSSQYSNEGYLLLALIIEKASGASYADFLKGRIFRPLGMGQTTSRCQFGRDRLHPQGYYAGGPRGVSPVPFDEAAWDGPGSIVSSVDDLLVWLQALATDRLSRFHALEYPYGWGRRNYSGRDLVEQSGELQGFVSHMALYSGDQKLCFVVLSNIESGLFNRIPRDMEAVLFGGTASTPPEFREQPADPSVLGKYAGVYKCPEVPVPAHIDIRDGRLWMHWGEDPFWKPLVFGGSDTAFLRAQYATIKFQTDDQGRVTGSSWDWGGGQPLQFKKLGS
jgi:CubicO group peptidase (beta-lactamase class C family)